LMIAASHRRASPPLHVDLEAQVDLGRVIAAGDSSIPAVALSAERAASFSRLPA
jgi:hypothetical protein